MIATKARAVPVQCQEPGDSLGSLHVKAGPKDLGHTLLLLKVHQHVVFLEVEQPGLQSVPI